MSLSQVTPDSNRHGNTNVMGYEIPFIQCDGLDYKFFSYMPDNIPEQLQYLRDMEVYDDDIFICTYPRSGTNWTYEIVTMLLTGDTTYRKPLFEFIDICPQERIEQIKRPRLFGSHFPLRYLPKQLAEKGRVICVFRNPKDVAVSVHNLLTSIKFAKYNGSFDESLKIFLDGNLPNGSWFDYVPEMEKDLTEKKCASVLHLYYEDMKSDLYTYVEKIANFLALQPSVELVSAITEKCDFSTMYRVKQSEIPREVSSCCKQRDYHYMYRKGEVGNWKQWFTVRHNEQFDKIFQERMHGSKMIFKFSNQC